MQQDRFDRLVGDLYNTVVDPSSWSQVLLDLRGAFGASHATLVSGRTWGGRFHNHCRSTEPALDDAFNRWCADHERVPISSVKLRVGEVATDRRVVERTSLTRTPYFHEVLVPFEASNVMMIKIAKPPGPTLNVLRGNGKAEFDDDELALAKRLSYHAVQAIRGLTAVGGHEWSGFVGKVEEAGEGIVLVDDRGDVLHANALARALLATHDGVKTHGCRFGATDHRADRRLRQAIWTATEGPTPRGGSMLTIERASGARSLIVDVTPVAERTLDLGLFPRLAAVVSIIDPEHAVAASMTEALRQTYGITRRECEVVDALAAGLTIAEAAARCNVTLATARNYLARALRKTDLHRQGDLVLLVQRMSRLPGRNGFGVARPPGAQLARAL